MYMKVFPHGKGRGELPINYLLRKDYPDRDTSPPCLVQGNPELSISLINSLETSWKFTAGILSWHPDDEVTLEKEKELIADFEKLAFAGMEKDQHNILWVRHTHAKHHELHFVIPRVELSTGKAFNPCPPNWQKDFDVFRDYYNEKAQWVKPNDPTRARLVLAEHTNLHKARLKRWGNLKKDELEEVRNALHTSVLENVEAGFIQNREEVINHLKSLDLEINRASKDYITVMDKETNTKIRLKGAIYGEQFKLPSPENTAEKQKSANANRGIDSKRVDQLTNELEIKIAKRATYNRKRYARPHRKYIQFIAQVPEIKQESPFITYNEDLRNKLSHNFRDIPRCNECQLLMESLDREANREFLESFKDVEGRNPTKREHPSEAHKPDMGNTTFRDSEKWSNEQVYSFTPKTNSCQWVDNRKQTRFQNSELLGATNDRNSNISHRSNQNHAKRAGSLERTILDSRSKAYQTRTNSERLADNARRIRENAEHTLERTRRSFELMQGLRSKFDNTISKSQNIVERVRGVGSQFEKRRVNNRARSWLGI